MIIDFHTHAFPANVAAKATSKNYIKPTLNGSYDELVASMQVSGIDYSLILPVSTKEGMHVNLNSYAAQINQNSANNGLLSFGSIFPGETDWENALLRVKELELKGIKIQPSFQKCRLCDERVFDLVKYALDIELFVLIHVGPDYPRLEYDCATPKMAFDLINRLPSTSNLILAHLGGYNYPEDAFNYIAGSDVYLDTSMCTETMGLEMMENIIKKHGSNKILFGTDSPWYSQKNAINDIRRLNLTDEELDEIFYKNAAYILDIKKA